MRSFLSTLSTERGSFLHGARVCLVFSLIAFLGAREASAQGGTDIWVVPVIHAPNQIGLGTPKNLTNRPGYDNQPAFTASGRSVLYTSIREDAQADIWRVSVDGGAPERVTRTTESEYSATLLPDGSGMSVVRVETDSTQRLWSFTFDGTARQPIFPTLKPVGYHVWVGEGRMGAFVLGEPNALAITDPRTGKIDTVARGIQRALARVPGTQSFSFVRTVDRDLFVVDLSDPSAMSHASTAPHATATPQKITQLPPGAEYHLWTRSGALIASEGSRLLVAKDNEWQVIADFSALGIRNITRLALSPGGDLLAFVADDPSAP